MVGGLPPALIDRVAVPVALAPVRTGAPMTVPDVLSTRMGCMSAVEGPSTKRLQAGCAGHTGADATAAFAGGTVAAVTTRTTRTLKAMARAERRIRDRCPPTPHPFVTLAGTVAKA